MFILFEGGDGTGKSTQLDLLKSKMEFTPFRYPTDKFSMLRDHLDKRINLPPKTLFLTFLADISNEQEELETALEKGNVLMDRYALSTIAYEVEGIPYENAKSIVTNLNLIKPDKIFLFDLPAEEAQMRKKGQKDPDRYESDVEYLDKVRKNFLKLKEEKFMCNNWMVLDCTKPIEELSENILNELKV